jgi:hypothetical protein
MQLSEQNWSGYDQLAARLAIGAGSGLIRFVRSGDYASCVVKVALTRLRHSHVSGRTIEQLDAQTLFQ